MLKGHNFICRCTVEKVVLNVGPLTPLFVKLM